MRRFHACVFIFCVIGCGSEGTFVGGGSSGDPHDAGPDGAGGSSHAAGSGGSGSCDQGTPPGQPCAVDSDCKSLSVCEAPRCNEATFTCIVTAGAPDGLPCENAGACLAYRCCRP